MAIGDISIHALVKRATGRRECIDCYTKNFNPRPREEGDNVILAVFLSDNDFNPRPREEGDNSSRLLPYCCRLISIHALVKRATNTLQG